MDNPHPDITVTVKIKGFTIDEGKVEEIASKICSHLGLKSYELHVAFVGTKKIHALNRQYRNIDRVTDVLSFPQIDWAIPIDDQFVPSPKYLNETIVTPHLLLGDIVLCPQYAEKNAKNIGQPLEKELAFLLVHGILHLCGHDHQEPAEEETMIKMQTKLMNLLVRKDKTPMWSNLAHRTGNKS